MFNITLFLSREELDKQQQKWYEDSLKYEDAHLGNFRRIYPAEGSEKYDKYFQNSGSLYQETAAFKARSECARFVSQVIRFLDFYSVCDTFLHLDVLKSIHCSTLNSLSLEN